MPVVLERPLVGGIACPDSTTCCLAFPLSFLSWAIRDRGDISGLAALSFSLALSFTPSLTRDRGEIARGDARGDTARGEVVRGDTRPGDVRSERGDIDCGDPSFRFFLSTLPEEDVREI